MRFGIIGTNFVTDWFIKNGKKTEGFSVEAVYSRTMEHAREYGAACGARLFFDKLEDLAACDTVDAVYIASPHICHRPQAELMLRSGKHVIVEKPAAPNAADEAEMAALAREKGLVIMEAMRPAHNPALAAIKENIHKIGDLHRANICFDQYSSRYDRFKAGEHMNAFDPLLGNMAMLDVGVYPIYLMGALFGRPDDLGARFITLDNGFEAAGDISMYYRSRKMLANVQYSKLNNSKNRIELQGERGSMLIGDVISLEEVVIEYDTGEREIVYPATVGREGDMVYEINDFNAMVAGKLGWQSFFDEAILTAELMEEARRYITKV